MAQLATPRKRSSRRSRPFSGRVALIFMAAVRGDVYYRPSGRDVCGTIGQVVRFRYSDYTGRENVPSCARESATEFPKGGSILSRRVAPRACRVAILAHFD